MGFVETDFECPGLFGPALLRGEIRLTPEDFRVVERLGFAPDGEGEHVFVLVRKTGANTDWVAGELAEFVGISRRDVSYAGRKDRHAVTDQWFSCWLPGQADPNFDDVNIEGVKILDVARHTRKLRRGEHAANQFCISIKNLTPVPDGPFSGLSEEQIKSHIEERLQDIKDVGFPNYFGVQRFGFDHQNLRSASDFLARTNATSGRSGASKGKGRRQRRHQHQDLYLSAVRSWLFNRVLAARVKDGSWNQAEPDGRKPTGPLFGTIRRPHPGQRSERDIMLDACGEERLGNWETAFAALSVSGARRGLCVKPQEFSWRWLGDASEAGLEVRFELETGSYATSLLDQVVEVS